MDISIILNIIILFASIIIISTTLSYKKFKIIKESYNESKDQSKDGTIFVSIASYRDNACKLTLKNLYETAKIPARVFVGICEQNNENQQEEFCGNIEEYKNNIRKIKLNYKEAKGPMYARSLINTLYFDEDYFLMVDSHTTFIDNWDEGFIKQIKKLKENGYKKPIISGYPQDSINMKNKELIQLCKITHTDNEYPAMFLAHSRANNGKMKQCLLISAGCIFSIGDFVKDIPLYATLSHIFGGEEILMAYIAFIKGYDVFSPNKNLLYHDYSPSPRPKVWEDNNDENKHREEKESKDKLKKLLYSTEIKGERDGKEFWKLLGWNKETGKMSKEKEDYWCFDSPEI